MAESSRTFDATLTADEIASIKSRMGDVRLLTYRVEGAGSRASIEKALRFAKDMGAETVVVPAGTSAGWPRRDGRSSGHQRRRHGGQRPARRGC